MIGRLINPGLGVILLFLAVGAADAAGAVEASNAWVRAVPPGHSVTAAFFTLINNGQSSCHLQSVATEIADRGEIHRHENENGVMRMRRVVSVEIPAGGSRVFAPGGHHVMLFGLKRHLLDGNSAVLQLKFSNCETVTVLAEVRSPLREESPHQNNQDG